MNKVLVFSCVAAIAAPMAFSGESLAQSSGPISTETVEQWNSQLRKQVRQLEAEKEKVELRQRQRRLQAEKENAELHERVRQLQSDLSSMQPSNSQPSPLPQRPAAASNPQPEGSPPTSAASKPSSQPQHAPAAPIVRHERAATVAATEPQRAAPGPQPQRAAPTERRPSRAHETAARERASQVAPEPRNPQRDGFPDFAAFQAAFPTAGSASAPAPAASASAPAPAASASAPAPAASTWALPTAAFAAAPAPTALPVASDASIAVQGTIDLKSSPEGATAQTSLGGGCETPCSMEVASDRPFTVTFSHRGYAPSTVNIQIQRGQPGVTDPKFAPNPVFVQLMPSRRP